MSNGIAGASQEVELPNRFPCYKLTADPGSPQLLSRGREQFNLARSLVAPIDGRYKIADARRSAVGYTRIPASRRVDRTYVAAFNKACNPQTTEDADTWLVYGGL
ncbi:hypothetical protein ALC56_08701 [Trachymyrmex septentrionalis]|uniref:Uncharacterized protein n=1 Tax=Trachymyrmex septentrionalis TaxID=34720 RepID=A0A195F8G2_9HYME|nr:hypothetical protein ALC56_08701 [Trachymyrmex septentrionalis]